MTQNCCESSSDLMILSCSGGSNVGQLSNQAAVELTQEGFGKMFCLAGIGGKLSGFVQSAKDAPEMVLIDGCPVGCGRAILEQAEIPLAHYLVLTEQGIEKNKNFDLERSDIERVKDAVKGLVKEESASLADPSDPKTINACTCGGKC